MAFKDVLGFLFERARQRGAVNNQEDFAIKHGITREHMNQFLTGNAPVPSKTIWEILEREGYDLGDCIQLPDFEEARSKKRYLYDDLDAIVMSGDPERIHGIDVSLHDLAKGARSGKPFARPDRRATREEKGNVAPKEKKRAVRKHRRAS